MSKLAYCAGSMHGRPYASAACQSSFLRSSDPLQCTLTQRPARKSGEKVTYSKQDISVGLWPYNFDVTPDGKLALSDRQARGGVAAERK